MIGIDTGGLHGFIDCSDVLIITGTVAKVVLNQISWRSTTPYHVSERQHKTGPENNAEMWPERFLEQQCSGFNRCLWNFR
jgi:hypothetical protein